MCDEYDSPRAIGISECETDVSYKTESSCKTCVSCGNQFTPASPESSCNTCSCCYCPQQDEFIDLPNFSWKILTNIITLNVGCLRIVVDEFCSYVMEFVDMHCPQFHTPIKMFLDAITYVLHTIIIYMDNFRQYVINYFSEFFQDSIQCNEYYVSGQQENVITKKGKFKMRLNMDNPLALAEYIPANNGQYMSGNVELYIKYQPDKTKDHYQTKTQLYRYSWTNPPCLELLGEQSTPPTCFPENSRTLCKTNLVVKEVDYCNIRLVLCGQLKGNAGECNVDKLTACAKVKLVKINKN